MKIGHGVWDRTFWGIEFESSEGKFLIGGGWHKDMLKPQYIGQPTRPILFINRELAREWCDAENAKFAGGSYPADWKVRPIKVREVIAKAEMKK